MSKKFVLIDGRAEKYISEPLKALGYEVLSLPPFDKLDTPVAAHPDMLVWIYGRKIITHSEYYPIARSVFEKLEKHGFEIDLSEQIVSKKYPSDVPLNCALVGNLLIANTAALSPFIANVAKEKQLSILHVNQGYAKCSTLIVDDNSVITADASIANVCLNVGFDVLKIREGHIRLDGYGYGFIGGCGGIDGNRIFFAGDPVLHPDGDEILNFCEKHGKQISVLSDLPLFDVGSLFFI